MNVQTSHVMPMLPVLTMKVHLAVNVMLDILETDLIVLVSKSFLHASQFFYLFRQYVLFVLYFCRH